jgi:hypothetical protein
MAIAGKNEFRVTTDSFRPDRLNFSANSLAAIHLKVDVPHVFGRE